MILLHLQEKSKNNIIILIILLSFNVKIISQNKNLTHYKPLIRQNFIKSNPLSLLYGHLFFPLTSEIRLSLEKGITKTVSVESTLGYILQSSLIYMVRDSSIFNARWLRVRGFRVEFQIRYYIWDFIEKVNFLSFINNININENTSGLYVAPFVSYAAADYYYFFKRNIRIEETNFMIYLGYQRQLFYLFSNPVYVDVFLGYGFKQSNFISYDAIGTPKYEDIPIYNTPEKTRFGVNLAMPF